MKAQNTNLRNIYGNGVNIAARLESQAPVGEILISEVVKQQVYNKIEEAIYSLGKIELKNISNNFEVSSKNIFLFSSQEITSGSSKLLIS